MEPDAGFEGSETGKLSFLLVHAFKMTSVNIPVRSPRLSIHNFPQILNHLVEGDDIHLAIVLHYFRLAVLARTRSLQHELEK